MPQAQTNVVSVRIRKEDDWAEEVVGGPGNRDAGSPGDDFYKLRNTGGSLAHNKQTVVSETILDTRERSDLIEVAASAGGDLNYEVAHPGQAPANEEFGLLLQGAMFKNTFVTFTASETFTISGAGGGDFQLVRGAGSWITDGAVAGMWIRLSGFADADTNTVYMIKTVDNATTLQVWDPKNESANNGGGEAATVFAKMIRNGSDNVSFTIEQEYADLDPVYIVYPGMRVASMQLNMAAQQIFTGSFSFEGKQGFTDIVPLISTSAYVDPPTTSVMNASANLGKLHQIDTTTGNWVDTTIAVRSLQFTVNNNLRTLPAIGNKFPVGVGAGFVDVSGTIEAYFENRTFYDDFVNHKSSGFSGVFTDGDGNHLIVTLPRIIYSSGAPQVPGGNQDVIINAEFQAVQDGVTGTTVQFDLL